MPEMISRHALTLACLVAFASPVLADVSPADAEKAAALFKEAQAMLDTGTNDARVITQACAKFEQSLKLDPQLGTRMNLAACRAKQGKNLEAFRLYEESLVEATQTGQAGREAFARKEMRALGSKLVRVSLSILKEPPELTIEVGGEPIARERWSQSIVVAAGTVVITARAPGRESVRIEKSAARGEVLAIDIPELAVSPTGAGRSRKVAYIVGGAGTALMLTSFVVGLHAKRRYDDAKTAGDPDGISSAQAEADIATGFFIAGAVGIGVGAFLFVHARREERAAIVPTATADSLGVAVVGGF